MSTIRSRFLVIALVCTLNSCPAFPALEQVESTKDCHMVVPNDLRDAKAPMFESYTIKMPESVSHPKVDVKTSETGRMFRTVLSQSVRRGPNFAGHYRVVVWGCGSSCASFAVVNLITGRLLGTDEFGAINGVDFYVDGFMPKTDSDDTSFRYRKNSKLLVILGAQDEHPEKAGAFYYLLDDDHLKLVHTTLVAKKCANQ